MREMSLFRTSILFISFIIFSCHTTRKIQKNDTPVSFDQIFAEVKKNILVNYRGPYNAVVEFNEYTFNNTTREIFEAVQVNGFIEGYNVSSRVPPYTRGENYIINGNLYKKERGDYGFSFPMLMDFPGNSYSNYITNHAVGLLIQDYTLNQYKDQPSPVICRDGGIFNSELLSLDRINKDSIVNGSDFIYTIETKRERFTLEIENPLEKFAGIEDWKKYELTQVTEYLIARESYAVVEFRRSILYESKIVQKKFHSRQINKFVKIGDCYFENYYEYLLPRFFPNVCGFNFDDLYTLMVKKQAISPGNVDSINVEKYQRDRQLLFEDFCERSDSLTQELLVEWNHFWKT